MQDQPPPIFIPKVLVRAQAIVDFVSRGVPHSRWKVTVTGQPPDEHSRSYLIMAKSDNDAAREGIQRFVDEMLALRGAANAG